jgi:hypothetical protein
MRRASSRFTVSTAMGMRSPGNGDGGYGFEYYRIT